MKKHYLNHRTGEDTTSAVCAMKWHRAGDLVQVNIFHDEPHKTGLANVVHIPGAPQEQKTRDDENRQTCKRIAQEIEAYADGNVYRCPDCGQEIELPNDVGDKYRCPGCHAVNDVDNLEQLGIYDYMEDILDISFTVSRDREYRNCTILVTWGGPNIYIETGSAYVKLYWWSEYAEYPLSYSARDAIDDWAEEYWACY